MTSGREAFSLLWKKVKGWSRFFYPYRRLRFTREGWLFSLLSLSIGLIAVNTGHNLFYLVFGLLLGMVIVSGMLSERVLRGVRVERHLPAEVTARIPFAVVLTDEINRSTPRTQSALLEAMNEGQVTLDSTTYPLPQPFMVLATQNPAEFAGTFPLPESQLDRFLMRISLGYPDRASEEQVLTNHHEPKELKPVMQAEEVVEMQKLTEQVRIDRTLVGYILDIIEATRTSHAISLGGSPRASKSLYRAAQAFAFLEGLDYVLPRHIKELAVPVLAHRLLLKEAGNRPAQLRQAEGILQALLEEINVPL